MRALVADDSKVSREIIGLHLRNLGIDVIDEARDGLETIAKIKTLPSNEKYEIIILDINMPNKDGLSALKEIKSLTPKSKIIMCTSANDIRSVEIARGFGVSGYVLKPVTMEKLKETLWRSFKK